MIAAVAKLTASRVLMEWAQLPPTARARAFALLGDVGADAAGGVIDASGMRRVALLMRLVPRRQAAKDRVPLAPAVRIPNEVAFAAVQRVSAARHPLPLVGHLARVEREAALLPPLRPVPRPARAVARR